MNKLMLLVPWYVRWLLVLGVLLSAAAAGAWKMHEYDEKELTDVTERFSRFRTDSKTLAVKREAEVKVERLARNDQSKKAEAGHELALNDTAARNADVFASLRADVERLRPGSDQLSGVPGSAAIPVDSRVCYDEQTLVDRLKADLGRFVRRLEPVVGRGEAALIGYEWARIWAQAQKELKP